MPVYRLFDKANFPPANLARKEAKKSENSNIVIFNSDIRENLDYKIFLNVSKKEQAERFLSRIEEPEKNWKFSDSDFEERVYWDDYQQAFEDAINATSTTTPNLFSNNGAKTCSLRCLVAIKSVLSLNSVCIYHNSSI